MAHGRPRLNVYGRQLLVDRVLRQGWSVAAAAEALQVSRQTGYRWLRRYRAEGPAGLRDRPPIARCRPHALPRAVEQRILRARHQHRWGPHRLAWHLGLPRSTIYGVLRRHRVPRLAACDRPTRRPVRYTRQQPGELLHLDVKKLGRIPPGGGHRIWGRPHGRRRGRRGYDFLHVAIDDCSRVAFVQAYPDERGPTTARFLAQAAAFFAARGVRIQAVMTDRAWGYTRAAAFRAVLARLGARHLVTQPYRPQTNGKAERFIKTLLEEWAYARLYRSNPARLHTLSAWVAAYNQHRPHTALDGSPPMRILVNKARGNHI